MANSHKYQPLLGTSGETATKFKVLYVVVSLAAMLGAVAVFSVAILKSSPSSAAAARLCSQAYDESSCLAMVSGLVQSSDEDLLRMVLAKSSSQIRETSEFMEHVNSRINDKAEQVGLEDCLELMDLSMDRVKESMAVLRIQTAKSHSDAHSWLSSVLTNHVTCLDGLKHGVARLLMEPKMNELISSARTSLALMAAIEPPKEEMLQPLNVRDFPSWITRKDRRLLEASAEYIDANAVVAQDGTGDYTTVQAAVDAAPKNPKSRYVIYVKKGTYLEQVNVKKNKKNLMLVGDGMDSTIISGSLNVVDGSSTFRSATVAAVADGFIAQDICFQNTAGPEKHQAVALRIGADQSVINRCKIDAFQDTLYAHSLRQFYRDCYITGTVDFIFGDGSVVIQNSKVEPRLPMKNQQNMVTAQGRKDPNSNTGTSIQYCNITASSDLEAMAGSVRTFLGRPWKEYSRTVVMETSIGDVIDPAGWSPWSGDFALATLYYGEYMNSGAGAGTGKRVKWPGYHVITSAEEARKFTVAEFIQGEEWLKNTGITYNEGL